MSHGHGDKIPKAPRSLLPRLVPRTRRLDAAPTAGPASVAGGRRRHGRGAPARPLLVGRSYPAGRAGLDVPSARPWGFRRPVCPPLAIIASELTSGATAYRMGTGGGTGGGVGSVARRPDSKQKQRKKIMDNLEIEDG